MENIVEIVRGIIEEITDIPQDEINMESKIIDDLNLSSLEILSIVSMLEKKFSIKITAEELLLIGTIEELCQIIETKIK